VPEQFIEGELRRDRPYAKGVKSDGSTTEVMDILGEERFSRTALAVQYDRRRRGRERMRPRNRFNHRRSHRNRLVRRRRRRAIRLQ
jgi:hypothetical protein